jgi:hypothetical protein
VAGLAAFLLLSRALAVGKARAADQREADAIARRSVSESARAGGGS